TAVGNRERHVGIRSSFYYFEPSSRGDFQTGTFKDRAYRFCRTANRAALGHGCNPNSLVSNASTRRLSALGRNPTDLCQDSVGCQSGLVKTSWATFQPE